MKSNGKKVNLIALLIRIFLVGLLFQILLVLKKKHFGLNNYRFFHFHSLPVVWEDSDTKLMFTVKPVYSGHAVKWTPCNNGHLFVKPVSQEIKTL